MTRHYARWLEFVTQSLCLDYRPEDLIFVRGTVKTTPKAWAVGAYLEDGDSVHKVSVHMNAGAVARVGFDLASQRNAGRRFDYRIGLGDYDPLLDTAAPSPPTPAGSQSANSSSADLPEVLLEQQAGYIVSPPPAGPINQCIFLQYFKLKPRRAVLGMFSKIVAGAGPDQLPPPEDPSSAPPVIVDGGTYDVEAAPEQQVGRSIQNNSTLIPYVFQRRSAVDDILDYILRVRERMPLTLAIIGLLNVMVVFQCQRCRSQRRGSLGCLISTRSGPSHF